MAQTESDDKIDAFSNATANASTGSIHHPGLFNGAPAHSMLPPVLIPQTVNPASVSAASNNDLQSRIPFTSENGTSKQKSEKSL